jgi:hypothetical protein
MDDLDPRAAYRDPIEAGEFIHQTVEGLVYDLSPEFVGPRQPERTLVLDSLAAVLAMDAGQLKTMREAYRRMVVEGMVIILGLGAPARDFDNLEEMVYGRMPTLIGLDDFYLPAEAYVPPPPPTWQAPLRAPARVKQAPRQSFRKIMRSVNRNR